MTLLLEIEVDLKRTPHPERVGRSLIPLHRPGNAAKCNLVDVTSNSRFPFQYASCLEAICLQSIRDPYSGERLTKIEPGFGSFSGYAGPKFTTEAK